MSDRRTGGLRGAAGSVFRGVDLARRIVVNFVFLAILFFAVAWWSGDDGEGVPASAALVIAPRGEIVEQLSGNAVDRAVGKLTGDETPETLKRDLVRAIRQAKDDDRIKALLFNLNSMSGAGLSKLQDLRAVIDDFKTSGKPVIATSEFFGKGQYYLATAADEIYLHHMGIVMLDGYGRFRSYYRDGLDRAEIDWNVFRVGEFKSAVEPYLRDDMSTEAREANLEWLGDLWQSYLVDVAAARNTTPEAFEEGIARFNDHLEEAAGQASQVALRQGWVDHVGSRDELRQRMIELVGEDDSHSYHRVGHETYLDDVGRDANYGDGESKIALLVAKGQIQGGSQPPGVIGGDSTAQLIRDARHDDDVKAIVLQVDSPGGSAFASEVIRRELVLARQAGKKVVVSMGSVAASGGYWISTASDEIWANPNTITGSIGIFGMLPTFQKPLAKHLGTRVDGVGTTWLSGVGRPDRELDPQVAQAMQRMIEQGYQDFLDRVAEARGMTTEEVDEIARGRVWSGADAKDLGLVDRLGGLEEAIASAAEMTGLEEYRVEYLEEEPDFYDQMLIEMLAWSHALYQPESRAAQRPQLGDVVVDYISEKAEMLLQFDDPRGIYAHCMCEVE
ncbi:MAG: signal peptide peptidase SppA [Acidobacteriota bacterium]